MTDTRRRMPGRPKIIRKYRREMLPAPAKYHNSIPCKFHVPVEFELWPVPGMVG